MKVGSPEYLNTLLCCNVTSKGLRSENNYRKLIVPRASNKTFTSIVSVFVDQFYGIIYQMQYEDLKVLTLKNLTLKRTYISVISLLIAQMILFTINRLISNHTLIVQHR